jgi:hypothetical protein
MYVSIQNKSLRDDDYRNANLPALICSSFTIPPYWRGFRTSGPECQSEYNCSFQWILRTSMNVKVSVKSVLDASATSSGISSTAESRITMTDT